MNSVLNRTLIFVDWDDTLFPTNWLRDVDINLKSPTNDIIVLFRELDLLISQILISMSLIGNVVIVTNGTSSWIQQCLNVLKGFRQLIENRTATIISARDIFQEDDHDHEEWKKLTFKLVFNEYISNTKGTHRILSFGDSQAEHNAVMDLQNHNCSEEQNRIIGSIKFIRNPTLNQLLSQLHIISFMHKEIFELSNNHVYNLSEFI